MNEQAQALLDAWEAWEARPGAEHTARAMELACDRFTDATLALRRYLSSSRRRGRTRADIIRDWEDAHA